MLSDLNNLRHEATQVNNDRNVAQMSYVQMKQNIHQTNGLSIINGHRPLNPRMPSYLQDKRGEKENLIVESARVSLQPIEHDRPGGNVDNKIYESTRQLKQRDSTGIDAVSVALEQNDFYDRII